MDFFERQERARRRTAWLIALFVVAVVLIVLAVMAIAAAVGSGVTVQSSGATGTRVVGEPVNWPFVFIAGVATLATIVIGSLIRTLQLGRGGDAVATGLGAEPVTSSAGDLDRQRLMNVVQEMAVASGIACPRIYLLEEEHGINAFAAGYRSEDAVIGVTRGAITQLSRAELQGVVAHEFSHILNGDMRLNLRLIGVLHGILLLSIIGRSLMQSQRRRSRSREKGGWWLVLVGLGLYAVGSIGLLAGRLIKATVSREREYLADASAVQFTRNPAGIGGALVKLMQLDGGSRLLAGRAEEISHMLFGEYRSLWLGWLATHPPLEERIHAIDPALLQGLPARAPTPSPEIEPRPQLSEPPGPAFLAASVGEVRSRHVERARLLVEGIPEWVRAEIAFPLGAQCACLSLALDSGDQREEQLALVQRRLGHEGREFTLRFEQALGALGPAERLPTVELAFPALRVLSRAEVDEFLELLHSLARADERISVFEWSLLAVLEAALSDSARPSRREADRLEPLREQAARLVALSVSISGAQGPAAEAAFAAASDELGFAVVPYAIVDWYAELSAALGSLRHLRPADKRRLCGAIVAAFLSDREATLQELEILRALNAGLGCPIPPVVAQSAPMADRSAFLRSKAR